MTVDLKLNVEMWIHYLSHYVFFVELCRLENKIKSDVGGCHQGERGQVEPEASKQVLNTIFRPVGKISSSFLGDRVPAAVQEEEVFNIVPETVRQAVRTFRSQYRYFY